jgi:hypothetical protein
MLVHDSRMLQIDPRRDSLLLPDVMTIVDELDSQTKQAIDRYINVVRSRYQSRRGQ